VDVITNQIYRKDGSPRFNQGMKSYVNQLLFTLMTGHVASTDWRPTSPDLAHSGF